MIDSPCTGVCRLDKTTALCQGCLRSRDEIAGWGPAGDAHRLQILANIGERLAAGHTRVAPAQET